MERGFRSWLLIGLTTVVAACAQAGNVDSAIVGTWYLAQETEEGQKQILIWKIRSEGKLVMCSGTIEKGVLSSNPERFGVSNPQGTGELFHGLYKIHGPDLFSTNSTDKPGDWVQWTRVANDAKPKDIEECLLSEVMNELKGAGHGEFNPGLVGLWQASIIDPRSYTQLVWRIVPSGQSVRIKLTTQSNELPFEANKGRIKLTTADGTVKEIKYAMASKEGLEISDESETLRLTRCQAGGK